MKTREMESISQSRKIAAFKLLKECNEAKFALLEKGPSILSVKAMQEESEKDPK